MVETRKAFHEELQELSDDVVRLGALVAEAIQAGTDAFLDADLTAAERVIGQDSVIDDIMHSVEGRTYLLLARQQPMAVDLRVLVTVLRIIHELERAGDNMVNVVKATRRLYPYQLDPKMRGLIHRMREQASAQVRLAVSAFAERDPARAAALGDMDDVMDDLQKDLFRTIFTSEVKDEASLQRAVQIALVGRYFERIADHAVNTGERVTFMVTGQFSEDPNRGEPPSDATSVNNG
ncbi:MAG TPA: phosphate signaling complex protein PhoU [Acidimicrobiales bacterium]|nr:phosphate signaling complex protein PhoU [Acidimicrobiales bacterium]